MTRVLLLSDGEQCLPALGLLPVTVTREPCEVSGALAVPADTVVVVDAVHDIGRARALLVALETAGVGGVLVVLDDGGMALVGSGWPCREVVHTTAGPAEVRARLARLGEDHPVDPEPADRIQLGELEIDLQAWSARVRGRALDLTFKEFELLRYLAARPGRVCTRDVLLDAVWGAQYFGGVRTVDVHVRRLRAKLGELEGLIETVRGVGYRANRTGQ